MRHCHWMTRYPQNPLYEILHAHRVRKRGFAKGFASWINKHWRDLYLDVFGVSQSYIWFLLTKLKRFENTLANCTMTVATMLKCWGLPLCEEVGGWAESGITGVRSGLGFACSVLGKSSKKKMEFFFHGCESHGQKNNITPTSYKSHQVCF